MSQSHHSGLAATACATTTATPDGPFSIIVRPAAGVGPSGVILASGWTADLARLLALVHPSLRPASLTFDPGDPALAGAMSAVDAYYAGDLRAIGVVPVHQVSGPFRTHAWDVLRTVDPGTPITYAKYAELCGRPAAIRAAAGACAANAAALFVPCHRVLRTDGTLGGFRYGLPVKASLLAREAPSPK